MKAVEDEGERNESVSEGEGLMAEGEAFKVIEIWWRDA